MGSGLQPCKMGPYQRPCCQACNRGARVILETTAGRQMREVHAGDSYLSSSDQRVHFGLGDATIRSVEIRWPSGIVQKLERISSGQYLIVREPGWDRWQKKSAQKSR